jgi:transposase InsO family protein
MHGMLFEPALQNAQLARSMSRKGCSPDNSACEGFFGRLKNEMFYNRTWVNTTPHEFMEQLDAYIQWYNQHRIKLSLGGNSPAEYRRNLGIAA